MQSSDAPSSGRAGDRHRLEQLPAAVTAESHDVLLGVDEPAHRGETAHLRIVDLHSVECQLAVGLVDDDLTVFIPRVHMKALFLSGLHCPDDGRVGRPNGNTSELIRPEVERPIRSNGRRRSRQAEALVGVGERVRDRRSIRVPERSAAPVALMLPMRPGGELKFVKVKRPT